MKRKKRLFGILLIITALIIMQLPVAEADAATSASDFKMEGNTLVKYQGTEKNVSVPDTVEVIGENAFAGNTNIELVVLPDSVTKIEPYAFWGCENLDNVVLGKGLTEVGDYVFANCKGLKTMSIPSNIKSIGIGAFTDCVNMTDISIAPEVSDIHLTAFDGCYKLTIHCQAGTVADKYAEAFYERQKEMPEYEDVSDYQTEEETEEVQEETDTSVSEIPEEAAGEAIGSTQVVGNQAVVFMDHTSLPVQSGRDEMKALKAEQQNGSDVSEGDIAKYTIVDGTIVADQAYYRNSQLQSVSLPEGILEIGQFAFARSSVTEIALPEGITTIGYGAFYHCDGLTELELPQSIENVEPQAFTYTAWVEDFLERGTEDFLVSGGVLVAYRGDGTQVVIPDGVRVIAGEVFAGHTEIESVALPDTLITIGEAAFADCSSLQNIYFGSQVRQIKDRAFQNCRLSMVTLPLTVEAVGLMAFDDTVELKYGGSQLPETTHELSAERLSNEAYRPCKEEQTEPGVTVVGVEGAAAHLDGAARSYTLTISEVTPAAGPVTASDFASGASDTSAMERAFQRNLQSTMPEGIVLYDLQLTDNSQIPITRLGKQPLTVTMPVPESLASQNLSLYTLDRNGQLEELEAERVNLDGADCFRFTVVYLSQIGVTGNGIAFDDSYIIEETTSISSMSAPPVQNSASFPIQWAIGGALFMGGTVCLFWRRRTSSTASR